MNIEWKDLKPLFGKQVIVIKKSGSMYHGTMFRLNKNKIVLTNYAFALNGLWMSPKHMYQGRAIAIEKIDCVLFCGGICKPITVKSDGWDMDKCRYKELAINYLKYESIISPIRKIGTQNGTGGTDDK
jgi:hypothetical protein